MNTKNTLRGHTGFIIDKLIIKNSKVFGETFQLNFFNVEDFINSNGVLEKPYATLIIGPNGTGKSLILKTISDVLLDVYNLAKENTFNKKDTVELNEEEKYKYLRKHTNEYFYLSFYNGGEFHEVKNYNDKTNYNRKRKSFDWSVEIDGQKKKFNNIFQPERIIAASLLLTDRFTVYRNAPETYKYLGVRSLTSPTTARTRNYVKRTVEQVVTALGNLELEIKNKITRLLTFLNFKPIFKIYYYPKYKEYFYTGELTVPKFEELFENYDNEKGFSKRESMSYLPFGVDYYNRHIAENKLLKSELVEFLNEIKNGNQLKKEVNSKTELMEFDIMNNELSLEKFMLLQELASLDLITYPSIRLVKNNDEIDIEDASSGEYHFISTMIGIYASIKQNSIVLIDEPEISLHPNWQMKYMSFLKELFKEYSSCHFIITSHSHFFASDLDGNNSLIIGLKNGDNYIEQVPLPPYNTYGWSAEDVLYSVFNVVTTRNYYVAKEIGDILKTIANKNIDLEFIKSKNKELENIKVNLKDSDPLKSLITKIQKEFI